MRLEIGSAWRNSIQNVAKYMIRVDRLRAMLDCEVVVISGEGDSIDATKPALAFEATKRDLPFRLVNCSHGKRIFGSTEEPDRLKALSFVLNCIVGAVSDEADIFLYVESDLQWEPADMAKLIRALDDPKAEDYDILAPLVMAGEVFYDIWGFRKDENRFSPFHPFHPSLNWEPGSYTPVDSVGSCLVMPGAVARTTRVTNDMALVGWCEDARRRGYSIAVRSDLKVYQA